MRKESRGKALSCDGAGHGLGSGETAGGLFVRLFNFFLSALFCSFETGFLFG